MNLGELRSLAKTLHYSLTGKMDIDDGQWDAFLNASARDIWLEMVALGGSRWAQDFDLVVTDGAGFFSGLPQDYHEILSLAYQSQTGEFIELPYVNFQDRRQYNIGMGLTVVEPSAWTAVGNSSFFLLPTTAGNLNVRVTWIPTLTDMASDADAPWSTRLPMFQALIAYGAVLTLTPANAAINLAKIEERTRSSLRNYLTTRQRSSRRIRDVSGD
ncbi:MAG TPA: hypothetical protein VIV60_12280 [Polyangiaceae bacterium]